MPRNQAYLDPIRSAPEGPDIAAFFDMDGTLLAGFSAYVFAQDRLRTPDIRHLGILREALAYRMGRSTFESLLRASAKMLEGETVEQVEKQAERLFRRNIAGLIYPEARAIIAAHRARGHRLIMISAATQFQVAAVADDLGFDEVIGNRLEILDGQLTGEVLEPIIYGDAKAATAVEVAEEYGIDLAESFAYSDGGEDLPLLEGVGNPRPLNPDKHLAAESKRRGWETLDFESRGRPPLSFILRTAAANMSMVPAVGAGLLAGALNRDRRQALNLAMSTWGEFAVAISGVDVQIEGEDHLWSARPCVFLFNHQSNFDGLLLMKVLRKDVTAIAKQQLSHMPLVGPLFSFGGVVFIDRTDHEQAVNALQSAVNTIRDGLSIAIAPEGTRQPTPNLGPFKKGGFHLAMEAGVPIVPIIIHNSHDVLPRGGRVMRPTTVRVTVGSPIPTSHWKTKDLDTHISDVRELYLETLGQVSGPKP
ncbi:MAG: HAD-IB family hydrolase [Acidimicrobiia bacterium]|nr:HAD-IB family hydrolase [Acidimicrobiia bacterium]